MSIPNNPFWSGVRAEIKVLKATGLSKSKVKQSIIKTRKLFPGYLSREFVCNSGIIDEILREIYQ